MPDDGLLSEITVLDLTEGAAGPFCTKLLADYGARLIKVERPGRGDPARRAGPFPEGPNPDAGVLFLYLNTGKESITLDLSSRSARPIVLELVEHVDAVIESAPPGRLDALGIGAKAMRQRNPRILVTNVSTFGTTGPYADFRSTDLTAFASGGQMSVSGDPGREPLLVAGHQAAFQTGMHAFGAVLAGLFSVGILEGGQELEVAGMEVMASTLELLLSDYVYRNTDILSKRRGNVAAATLGVFPAADGHIGVHLMARNFDAFARAAGNAALLEDERFRDARARILHNDELLAHVYQWAAGVTRARAYALAGEDRVMVAPVLTVPELLAHPHLRARNAFRELDDPRAGTLTYPGPPFRPGEGEWELRPAPRLGEHNVDVYGELLDLDKQDLVRLRAAGVI